MHAYSLTQSHRNTVSSSIIVTLDWHNMTWHDNHNINMTWASGKSREEKGDVMYEWKTWWMELAVERRSGEDRSMIGRLNLAAISSIPLLNFLLCFLARRPMALGWVGFSWSNRSIFQVSDKHWMLDCPLPFQWRNFEEKRCQQILVSSNFNNQII